MASPHALTKVEGGAIAKPFRTIKDLLQSEEFKSQVAAALPRHMTPDRFLRVALNATMRMPDLLNCTRESFFRCLLDLSAYGLEPDGRRAHLIPFRNNKMCTCGHEMDQHKGQTCTACNCERRAAAMECTLIIDYKGLAELVRRSGDVSYIHADVVYEKDEWSYSFGSNAHLKHVPNLEDRGEKVKAAYSFVRLKDGSEDFIVMSRSDVEKVRKASRASSSGPWVGWWDEMAKKTVFRRHSKWLPLSPEVKDAIERDDDVIELPNIDKAVVSLDSLRPSTDENRGHDHTAPSGDAATGTGTEEPAGRWRTFEDRQDDFFRMLAKLKELNPERGSLEYTLIAEKYGHSDPDKLTPDSAEAAYEEMGKLAAQYLMDALAKQNATSPGKEGANVKT